MSTVNQGGHAEPSIHDQTTPPPQIIASLDSWKDSAPVMRLSEYLKAHKDQGIKLCKSNGKPRLIFKPGLGLADMKTERWQVALNAIDLMQTASHDLKILMLNDLIDIKNDGAGPP